MTDEVYVCLRTHDQIAWTGDLDGHVNSTSFHNGYSKEIARDLLTGGFQNFPEENRPHAYHRDVDEQDLVRIAHGKRPKEE